MILDSEASKVDAVVCAFGLSSGRQQTIGIGRPIEARIYVHFKINKIEMEAKRNRGGSAMEVDQGDQEGGRSSASTLFKN